MRWFVSKWNYTDLGIEWRLLFQYFTLGKHRIGQNPKSDVQYGLIREKRCSRNLSNSPIPVIIRCSEQRNGAVLWRSRKLCWMTPHRVLWMECRASVTLRKLQTTISRYLSPAKETKRKGKGKQDNWRVSSVGESAFGGEIVDAVSNFELGCGWSWIAFLMC